MHFNEMTYRRITYEEVEAGYQELFQGLKAVSCEKDCRAVLKAHNRLSEKMTPIDLCYVRHGMDLNDPFYAGEQRYYDEIGPKIADLSNQFNRMLVDSPFRACFEELMGSFAFALIKSGLDGYPAKFPNCST